MIEIKIYNEEVFNRRPLLPLDVKERWLTALKSDTYPKGKRHLNKDNKFCCLGVLLEVEGCKAKVYSDDIKEYNGSAYGLTMKFRYADILESAGVFNGFQINQVNTLASLNDSTETFSEVIETIEKYF